MGAKAQKKTNLDQAFRWSKKGETEYQSLIMMNWLLLPKNRANVYVVTAKSKQSMMVVQYSSSPLLTEICLHAGAFIHDVWWRPTSLCHVTEKAFPSFSLLIVLSKFTG
jgi:hypothetical protein